MQHSLACWSAKRAVRPPARPRAPPPAPPPHASCAQTDLGAYSLAMQVKGALFSELYKPADLANAAEQVPRSVCDENLNLCSRAAVPQVLIDSGSLTTLKNEIFRLHRELAYKAPVSAVARMWSLRVHSRVC